MTNPLPISLDEAGTRASNMWAHAARQSGFGLELKMMAGSYVRNPLGH
jgi:hypothetical protein